MIQETRIDEMTQGTREWKPNNENCLKGCKGNCRYCYAKKKAKQYKRTTDETWPIMIPNGRYHRPVKFLEGGVMFPTTHDLHYENLHIWGEFLRELLIAGNEVLIVSKPEFASIVWICTSFNRPGWKERIEFRFTIGTDNDEKRKFWEPGASPIDERIKCLKFAYDLGFKTSVSMEPMIDYFPEILVKKIDQWVSGTIWIGIMNHMSVNDFTKEELSWYGEMQTINSKEHVQIVYDRLKMHPKIRWKDSIRELLNLGANLNEL